MKVAELIRKLQDYGDDTPVSVRTLEHGEVVLTVEVTRVKVENGEIVIVGDIDEAAGDVH